MSIYESTTLHLLQHRCKAEETTLIWDTLLSCQRRKIMVKNVRESIKFLLKMAYPTHRKEGGGKWHSLPSINGVEKHNPHPEEGRANVVNRMLCSMVYFLFLNIHPPPFHIRHTQNTLLLPKVVSSRGPFSHDIDPQTHKLKSVLPHTHLRCYAKRTVE